MLYHVFVSIWSTSFVMVVLVDNTGLLVLYCQSLRMLSRPRTSVSHSDGPFFLLCCVCRLSRLCVLPIMLCVSAKCPIYELVYPK
jgi:hypothetical protein